MIAGVVYVCPIFPLSDRDECSTKQHNCVQSCTNTVGSYTCSCYTGFNLDADGKSCSGISSKKCTIMLPVVLHLNTPTDKFKGTCF